MKGTWSCSNSRHWMSHFTSHHRATISVSDPPSPGRTAPTTSVQDRFIQVTHLKGHISPHTLPGLRIICCQTFRNHLHQIDIWAREPTTRQSLSAHYWHASLDQAGCSGTLYLLLMSHGFVYKDVMDGRRTVYRPRSERYFENCIL